MNLAHAKVGKNTKSAVALCDNKLFKSDPQRVALKNEVFIIPVMFNHETA